MLNCVSWKNDPPVLFVCDTRCVVSLPICVCVCALQPNQMYGKFKSFIKAATE